MPETAEALEAVGIIHPFPIQELTLPVALAGHDVIGQAKTGTGKTLGFGLPILENVVVQADVDYGRSFQDEVSDNPQALVVVPTRELCTQVANDLQTAGKARNVRVLSIYGGRAYEPQIEALQKGVDVVVGTPGRLLDLARQKKLVLSEVETLVLDEADEMLDLGFLPDVERIVEQLPSDRQTMLFSATMPGEVVGLARRYMNQPMHIRAADPEDSGATVRSVSQHIYRAHSMDKVEMIAKMLQAEGRGLAMIFCRTKRTTAAVAEQLQDRGFAAGSVHGDLGQGAREQALRAFRNGKIDVLVCTDVAARGIDVENVTHVVNFQCPDDEKTYLHRIGRTGRAGASGTAVTFVDWDDVPRWALINKALDLGFPEPVETYSTSPHFAEELNIPAGTKGVLPRAARTRAGLEAEEIEDLGEPGGGRGPRGRDGRGRDRDRDRDGRGRDGRGRDRDRGPGRDRDRAREDESGERERRQKRDRSRERRRLRNGVPIEGAPEAGTPAPSEAPTAVAEPAESTGSAGSGTRGKRGRNRKRSGQHAAVEAATAVEPLSQEPAVVEAAPVEAPVATVVEEKPKRTRARKSTAPKAVADEVAEAAEPVAAADAAEAVAAAPAEVAVAEKPKRAPRARKTAAAAPADSAEAVTEVEAEVKAEDKPKRTTRTRKAAPAKAEAALAVATEAPAETEAAEAPVAEKPKRATRTRKAAAAKASTAEAAEAVEAAGAAEAKAAEAKPKRVRKTAAKKAVAAVDGEAAGDEAPAKPARTRAPRKRAASVPAQAGAADEGRVPAGAAE
ncbi:DEAD/DEAH box helicase [Phaeacidiphilus oryzae]|uniref:DEAD/DEAH box helicase n=1 Tax=Phaeacidiphilus oryzae TaxID=348818 RepID=UPI0006910809|nr:DEAD/DEAH box helicase [Phaeacidiphilus oryzae]